MRIASTNCSARMRVGFTVLELIATVAVIGLLFGMLAVAVQTAREAARRNHCVSNLHQIGTAMASFEGVERRFPPSNHNGQGWERDILPHLAIPAAASKIDLYSCPTDPLATGDLTMWQQSYWASYGALGNSEGFARVNKHRGCRTSDFHDGLSQTAALSERLAFPPQSTLFTPDVADRAVHVTDGSADLDVYVDQCLHHSIPLANGWEGSLLFNHVVPPGTRSCHNGPGNALNPGFQSARTPRSLHPHGLNVLMADTSIRFINNSIDLTVWRAIGTRSGAEVVNLNAF